MSSRRGILAALEECGDFVSGQSLAARLGISRAAVWKHITALKQNGYAIEGARARGYRLLAAPAGLSSRSIACRLDARANGLRVGRRILVLDVTRSTNSDAMALGREGEPEGCVVLAEEQTAGRGRLGRSWESSRGVNLYMSILLRPQMAPWLAPQLSLVAGVAACEAVREEGIDARIKWPNDVVTVAAAPGNGSVGAGAAATTADAIDPADGEIATQPSLKKLAGILTEIEAEAERVAFVVVGIGVNINSDRSHFSPELEDKATSMLLESGRATDRAAFTARLLSRFEDCYEAWTAGGFAAVAPRWRALSVLEGRRLRVVAPGENLEGRSAGIDDDGALLLDTGGGALRRVLAGDVTLTGGY